jgi:hypothetical protein
MTVSGNRQATREALAAASSVLYSCCPVAGGHLGELEASRHARLGAHFAVNVIGQRLAHPSAPKNDHPVVMGPDRQKIEK